MRKINLMMGILVFALIFGIANIKALNVTENLKLEEDINEVVTVTGKEVVIDLNGHNIKKATNGVLRVYDGAKVTVKGEGTIESTNSNGVIVANGSTFTLESGNIKSSEFGVFVTNDSTFNMNGGVITTIDNCGAGGNGSDDDSYKNYTININGGVINANIKSAGYVSCGIYHPNKGTVNITGGVINSSNGAGIVQRAGTLNITGGTINARGTSTGMVGDSRVVVSASAVVVDKEANYPEVATLTTKISKDAILSGQSKDIETIGNGINIELTGGVYTEEPNENQIPEGYGAYKVLTGDNVDKYVIVSEDSLENRVVNGMVSKDSLEEEDINLIDEAIKDKYKLLSYYDVLLVTVTPNDDVVDYVSDATDKVKVTLGLPNDVKPVEFGYVRKYYVIRIHNGEVTVIDDVTDNGDGTVSFKSDKFSTYAIAYEDVKEEKVDANSQSNPKTSDKSITYITVLVLSLIGFIIGFTYYRKAKLKK